MSEYLRLREELMASVVAGKMSRDAMSEILDKFSSAHHQFEPDVDSSVPHAEVSASGINVVHIRRVGHKILPDLGSK